MIEDDLKIFIRKILMCREDNIYNAHLCIVDSSYEPLSKLAIDILHASEYQYYESLLHQERKHTYLLGRYAAKKALTIEPFCLLPQTCAILPGIFNQPILHSDHNHNVQISIAHCATMGAAMVYPEAHPIGIDIEFIDSNHIKSIKDQMTHEELNIAAFHLEKEDSVICLLWTAKEALSKILKTGLMIPFNILEISAIRVANGCFYSEFKNFYQYQSVSFQLGNKFVSLVYPRNTTIDLDVNQIQNTFAIEKLK